MRGQFVTLMKTRDINGLRFSSIAQPTADDIALWDSLSDEERATIIERDEQAAFESGVAEEASLRDIVSEARGERKRGP